MFVSSDCAQGHSVVKRFQHMSANPVMCPAICKYAKIFARLSLSPADSSLHFIISLCRALGGPPGINRPPMERAPSRAMSGRLGIEGDKWQQRGPPQGPQGAFGGSQFRPTPQGPDIHKTANRSDNEPAISSCCWPDMSESDTLERSQRPGADQELAKLHHPIICQLALSAWSQCCWCLFG